MLLMWTKVNMAAPWRARSKKPELYDTKKIANHIATSSFP